jgi:hypothetical protein
VADLKEGASYLDVAILENKLAHIPQVADVTYVSKDEALANFRATLKAQGQQDLTQYLDYNPLRASLDWRRREDEEWTILVTTADGTGVRLENGGSRLLIDGDAQDDDGAGEYPDIYARFLDLIDARQSLVDVAPLRLVADCWLAGSRQVVAPVGA